MKTDADNSANFQITVAQVNFEVGLLFDFANEKGAKFADLHQMIKGQHRGAQQKQKAKAATSENFAGSFHSAMGSMKQLRVVSFKCATV